MGSDGDRRDAATWLGRPCLVTGGAGFGGAHLCAVLLDLGARVIVIDRVLPRTSYLRLAGLADKVDLFYADVRDLETMQLCLERFQIRTVFHLAAQPIVPMSVTSPLETLSINALGTYALLEAARQSSFVESFVLASSGAYYGTTHGDEPITEETAPLPAANLYGPSKVAADIAARCYAATYGLNVGVCRFINTYGPGDTNFSRIVPRAVENLMRGAPYAFGDRDDGTTRLDYLHVSDMARGYVAVAERAAECRGEVFNFGTGALHSTAEVAEAVSLTFDGQARTPLFEGEPKPRPVVKRLDVSRAREKLGWSARYDLAAGLDETVSWYRRHWELL